MLSVVMPAHDEAEYLETAMREVHDGLRARDLNFELLVVENGSTDGTLELAHKLALEYPGLRVLSRLVTAVFGWLLRVGFSLSVSDTHGMKAMRRAPIELLVRRCRFASDLFDTELVIRAERSGLRVAELPARAEERRPLRTPIWRRVPGTIVGLVVLRITLWREGRGG